MAEYSIGEIQFFTFPYPGDAITRPMTEIEVRAGVDYHSTWVTGTVGRPMQILCLVDVTDLAAGIALIEAANAMIGTAQQVTWNDAQFDKLFDILDVQPGNDNGGIKPIALGVGGIEGASGAIVELIVTLIGTNEDLPEPP